MSCKVCGENRFANLAQLGCHVDKNHAEFTCGCNKKFMDENSLEQHKQNMLNKSKELSCSKCCRSFASPDALHQHKRGLNHWEPEERRKVQEEFGRFFCDDRCGRIFNSKSALASHTTSMLAMYGIHDNTCRCCEKSFLNKDRLDQHQKDTKHSQKRTSRVNEYLDNFHKKYIAISKHDKKAAVGRVDTMLRRTMDHIKKSEGGKIFCPNVVRAGSYPVKAKIGRPDEFDTNITLNVKPDSVKTRGKIDYALQPLDRQKGSPNNMNIPMRMKDSPDGKDIPMGYAAVSVKPDTVPAHLVYKGDLIPREVKRDLYERLKEAKNELNLKDVDLNRNAHGPALTATIHPDNGGHYISVDISPSVPCDIPISRYGWPRPDTKKAYDPDLIKKVEDAGMHLVPKGNEFWAVSSSRAEKVMLSNFDKGNGCRREVLRDIKKHVEICKSGTETGLPGVSSHIIKTAVLWASEMHPDQSYWQHGNVANCLIDTMGNLVSALRQGKLPNYFNTSENILKGKDRGVLRELGDYFKAEGDKLIHM